MNPAPGVVALMPMRDHSERVPGKNYRELGGRPLFHHVLETLLACPAISQVVIDTDSARIGEDAARHYPTVRVLERPVALRGPLVPMNEVLLHDVSVVPAELYLQTHSTNPLLTTATVSRAIDTFLSRRDEVDSLFSVTRLQTRLWDAQGRPLNHDPAVLLRTQDLPPVYEENSCLFLFTAAGLRARRNRIGERPLLFEMSAEEAWDIDEEIDFAVAEFLYLRRAQGRAVR